MAEYGYIRVSTADQNEDRQIIAMLDMSIAKENLYVDKQSGKDFDRPKYKKLIRKLRKGDTLYIKSIDRLGRNYEEILNQWRIITKEKKADMVVLDMPLLDKRRDKNLLGTFISDIVLQLLSFVSKMNGLPFGRGRRRELLPPKCEGFNLGGRESACHLTFTMPSEIGKTERFPFGRSCTPIKSAKPRFFAG